MFEFLTFGQILTFPVCHTPTHNIKIFTVIIIKNNITPITIAIIILVYSYHKIIHFDSFDQLIVTVLPLRGASPQSSGLKLLAMWRLRMPRGEMENENRCTSGLVVHDVIVVVFVVVIAVTITSEPTTSLSTHMWKTLNG
jgi:hypothetical protein